MKEGFFSWFQTKNTQAYEKAELIINKKPAGESFAFQVSPHFMINWKLIFGKVIKLIQDRIAVTR